MGVKICPRCGNEVEEGLPSCPFCGYSFSDEEDTAKIKVELSSEYQEIIPLMDKIGDKYEIKGVIGKGGFSKVFLVRDKLLDRLCALKVLLPKAVSDAEMLERFRREAKLYATLEHPNIVPIYEVGIYKNVAYIIMKYIEGITLKKYIKSKKKPLSVEEITRISKDILMALHYMHSRGIIHRDVKPANVILENHTGKAILADFGLAKRVDESGALTRSGEMLGTPYYVSPEQAKGEKTTPQSDIYSFGITLFEMATGKVPFLGETPFQILMKHVREPLPSPSKYNPAIPPELERIILKATDKKPRNRYKSALEMIRDLEQLSMKSRGFGVYSARTSVFSFKNILILILLIALLGGGYYYRDKVKEYVVQGITWIKEKIPAKSFKTLPVKKPKILKIPVFLRSDVPSKVYLGKKYVGKTPLHLYLMPGYYSLKIVSDIGSRKIKVKVSRKGKKIYVSFKTAKIGLIDSTPTAEVFLDGRDLGPTPIKNLSLVPGNHILEIKRKGYKTVKKTVKLSKGEKIDSIKFALVKEE